MDNQETPAEYKNKFMLSFVEMGWVNPAMIDSRYKNWTAGRMEIHDYESEYELDEKPFVTPYTDEWKKFREHYDIRWVDKDKLEKVIKMLKEKFYQVDENHDPIL